MSFENNLCPCGGKKERETMLCAACESKFAGHPSMAAFKNHDLPVTARRHAAEVLISLARCRNRKVGAK